MKRALLLCSLVALSFAALCQNSNNTLLWRISGKNISRPSYLFGTIHLLCADDIQLSDSLKSAIRRADKVYLELDIDNLFEMLGVISKMKMRNDTTLADLLTTEEYKRVKSFFTREKSIIPFSILETYKPILAASMLMESSLDCDNEVAMEHLIMKEAKRNGVGIKGLETMAYQISIFDSIPYQVQAKQLVKYIDNYTKDTDQDFQEMINAYKEQQLDKLEQLTLKDDPVLQKFADILLYNRNKNWVNKLNQLLPKNSYVFAVGAGHLPGQRGVINLLRKAGYKVEPVKNEMIKKKTKEI
ncbi:MAG: TraB/GumN family protein [Chitinophagaceae bacterium]|nr:TraB/GumN family protein [Chitinophagaceae bacterium]